MNTPSKRKDPLAVLKDQKARQRRDVVRATKFVAGSLSGEDLNRFVSEITVFLHKFATRMDCDGMAESDGGSR